MQSSSFFSQKNNVKRTLEVGALDSVNLTAIFALFLKETWHRFLEESAKFYLFPIAATGALISAILAIRQASIEKGKKGTLTKAVVEVAGALAIGTAVVGGLVGGAVFAVYSPIIFTAVLAAKTLYHGVASAYYWGKAAACKNNQEMRKTYRAQMKSNLIATASLGLATIAVGFAMLAAKPISAILGVVAGAMGVANAIYNRLFKKPTGPVTKPAPEVRITVKDDENEPLLTHTPSKGPSQSAQLHQTFPPSTSVSEVRITIKNGDENQPLQATGNGGSSQFEQLHQAYRPSLPAVDSKPTPQASNYGSVVPARQFLHGVTAPIEPQRVAANHPVQGDPSNGARGMVRSKSMGSL